VEERRKKTLTRWRQSRVGNTINLQGQGPVFGLVLGRSAPFIGKAPAPSLDRIVQGKDWGRIQADGHRDIRTDLRTDLRTAGRTGAMA